MGCQHLRSVHFYVDPLEPKLCRTTHRFGHIVVGQHLTTVHNSKAGLRIGSHHFSHLLPPNTHRLVRSNGRLPVPLSLPRFESRVNSCVVHWIQHSQRSPERVESHSHCRYRYYCQCCNCCVNGWVFPPGSLPEVGHSLQQTRGT